jgi:hypothetical protein
MIRLGENRGQEEPLAVLRTGSLGSCEAYCKAAIDAVERLGCNRVFVFGSYRAIHANGRSFLVWAVLVVNIFGGHKKSLPRNEIRAVEPANAVQVVVLLYSRLEPA